MTYFLPSADAVVSAARGLALAHPGQIEVHTSPLYLRALSSHPDRTVALISGGGSGHEPLHTGLLGPGGLDAVCPGEIFASPHNRQIYAAGVAAAKSDGVLLIIKNYTGDVINFQIAAERLRHESIPVATVLIDDDVATDNKDTATGRRGTAATVVVEKLLGAFADQGAKLDDLATLGAQIVARSRSLAVAARAQTSPATGEPAFALTPGSLEYGVGIHGERGTGTIEQRPVDELVHQMADELLAALPGEPDQVLAVVNGLGATTSLELHAIGSLLYDRLTSRGVRPVAVVPGTFTAALDMAGFSITLTSMEPEWVELWTASSDTPLVLPSRILTADAAAAAVVSGHVTSAPTEATAGSDRAVLDRFSQNVSQARANLTTLDQLVGDGDFGDNLAGGVQRALVLNASGTDGMTALANAFLDDVGGTSGPLFGLLFQQLAVVSFADDRAPDVQAVADAAAASYAAIHRVGGAEVGDCTLMDALAPAAEALAAAAREGSESPFTTAAEAAVQGALDTASLAPRRGRASYVGEHAIGVADPGALGVALLFSALAYVYEPDAAKRLPDPERMTARRE
ncbi:Glycerone kinase [Catenulispora acidiphila DSM 44928]|uniref:Glycerone kinase n=1 Tax=Catenulispora acidiphila (strain DSM 44928 / JCM 14897 / NBRC 102108 / NRRL B-24433 / ID139908) TaxID=479433 RepID=C7Q5T4_CATAD|nr:dihydroxyacetone kinase subunit DhaK [Catenulispora acidiphila]ACU70031.1 Glycerone kinase [Catenulispora acidiphila DSM 44928]